MDRTLGFEPPLTNCLFALDPSTSFISFEHDVEFQNLLPQATWIKRLELLAYPKSPSTHAAGEMR